MVAQFLIFLMLCGIVAGALYGTTKIGSAIFVVPSVCIFMPIFNMSPDRMLLPIIATAMVASIPMILFEWIQGMKTQQVNSTFLLALAPGAAMGGVIGAQLASLMPFGLFKWFFCMSLILIVLSSWMSYYPLKENSKGRFLVDFERHAMKMPIALLLGVVSVIGANVGRGWMFCILSVSTMKKENISGTTTGVTLFVAIASMVGFVFPAKTFALSGTEGFIGAIQWPCCVVLAMSQFVSYLFFRNKGNHLDLVVINVAACVFLGVAIVRLLSF